jgi:hypothetical protein
VVRSARIEHDARPDGASADKGPGAPVTDPCSLRLWKQLVLLQIQPDVLVEVRVGFGQDPRLAVLVVQSDLRVGRRRFDAVDDGDRVSGVESLDRRRLPEVAVCAELLGDRHVDAEFLVSDPMHGVGQVLAAIETTARPEPLAPGWIVRPPGQHDATVQFDDQVHTGLWHPSQTLGEDILGNVLVVDVHTLLSPAGRENHLGFKLSAVSTAPCSVAENRHNSLNWAYQESERVEAVSMVPERDESSDVRDAVRAVLADPAGETGRVPELLRLLDRSDAESRIVAAFSLSLIANADPEMVEPITRRLVDRLADEADNPETAHALAYLRNRFPQTVGDTLREIAEETRERAEQRRRHEISRGFARRSPHSGPQFDRGVGRTRFPGGDDADDPHSIYKREGEKVGGAPADAREDEAPTDGTMLEPGGDAGSDVADDTGSDETESPSEVEARQDQLDRLELAETDLRLEDLLARSRFDDLAVVAPPEEWRYTDMYRTRAVVGESEEGIALHTFRLPDDDREAFEDDACSALRNWQAVSDQEFVVPLYDWNRDPHLWMATAYTAKTLYDRVDIGLEEALWNGLRVAETIATAHQQGVLHTGLDPYNVVYSGNTIEGIEQPLVANFGLLDVLRMYEEPSAYLDPRYAAPEYFDRRFGQVDHATDIYQLGAVLYKLATGRAPFDGSYAEVRTAVLESTPVAPSEINPEIPQWFDEVVRKAMAKQKLTRYETANQLAREIRAGFGDEYA